MLLESLLESLSLLHLGLGRLAHSASHRNLLLDRLVGHGSTSLGGFLEATHLRICRCRGGCASRRSNHGHLHLWLASGLSLCLVASAVSLRVIGIGLAVHLFDLIMFLSGGSLGFLLVLEHSILDLSGFSLVLLFELLGAEITVILAILASSALALLALASTRLSESLLAPLLISQLDLSALLGLLHSPSLGPGSSSGASFLIFLDLLLSLDLVFALPLNDCMLGLDSLSLLLAQLLDAGLLLPLSGLESLLLLLAASSLELTSALGLLLLSLLDGKLAFALGGGLSALGLFLSLALDIKYTSSLKHNMVVPFGVNSTLHRVLFSSPMVSNVSHVVGVVTSVMGLMDSVPVAAPSHLLLLVVRVLVGAVGLDIGGLSAGGSSLEQTLMVGLAESSSSLALHGLSLLEKNLSPSGGSFALGLEAASQSSLSGLLLLSLSEHSGSSPLLLLQFLHLCGAQTGSFCSMDRSNSLSSDGNSLFALSHVLANLSSQLDLLLLLLSLRTDLNLLCWLLLLLLPCNTLLVSLNGRLGSRLAFLDLFHGLFHPLGFGFTTTATLGLNLSTNLNKSVFSHFTLAELIFRVRSRS